MSVITKSGERVVAALPNTNADVVLKPDGTGQVEATSQVVAGGDSTAQSSMRSGCVVNDDAHSDSTGDFRAETGSEPNALVVDAANNKVTLGVVLQLPVLGSAPGGLTNGMIWMESDGVHVYVNGAEYTLDMTAA